MIRRPPRSPLFPLPDALPICMSRCIDPRRGALRAGSQHWTKSRALGWGARMATRVASIHGVGLRERAAPRMGLAALAAACLRSEEHTSELQSQSNLVCRLLLE